MALIDRLSSAGPKRVASRWMAGAFAARSRSAFSNASKRSCASVTAGPISCSAITSI